MTFCDCIKGTLLKLCNWFQNYIDTIISFLMILFGATYFGYKNMPTEMGLAIVAGAICMAFSNLEKFASFKGAEFEAKIREVDATIDKSKEIMEDMKKLAKATIAANIEALAPNTFVSLDMYLNAEARKNELDFISKNLSIQQDVSITTASKRYHKRLCGAHLQKVKLLLQFKCKLSANQLNDLQPVLYISKNNYPTVEKLKSLLYSLNPSFDKVGNPVYEAIEDYGYYRKNRELRDGQILKRNT